MPRKLPSWLTVAPDGSLMIDPDIAYPLIVAKIADYAKRAVPRLDPKATDDETKKWLPILKEAAELVTEGKLTQYWIETVMQCAKLHAQKLVWGTELDTNTKGMFSVIKIMSGGGRKARWAATKQAPGRGERQASKGLEAKAVYRAIMFDLLAD